MIDFPVNSPSLHLKLTTTMSYPLPLSPLPSFCTDPSSGVETLPVYGFVDDVVVNRLVSARPVHQFQPVRTLPAQTELVLSSGDDDYAGWHGGICPRQAAQPAFAVPLFAVARPPHPCVPGRAAPPLAQEPGLEASYRSGHRWWLAAVAGAFSTLLFATVVLSLAQRAAMFEMDYSFYQTPPSTLPAEPASDLAPLPPTPQEITSSARP